MIVVQNPGKSKDDTELIETALHRSAFFTCLDEEQIQRFVDAAVLTTFEPGEVIINKGAEYDPGYENQEVEGQLALYVVRRGTCAVGVDCDDPASKPIYTAGKGDVFGEGAMLFHRSRSASVVSSVLNERDVECWAVSAQSMKDVLRSENMVSTFESYASQTGEDGEPLMTMDDFLASCIDSDQNDDLKSKELLKLRLANTFGILMMNEDAKKLVSFEEFCTFHLLMSRPDPEVDIAFILMDRERRGYITLSDFKTYVKARGAGTPFDEEGEFVRRYFGQDGTNIIRHYTFSHFLTGEFMFYFWTGSMLQMYNVYYEDFQREYGRQAFIHAVQAKGINNSLDPEQFVEVLKSSCGWPLPLSIVNRLQNLYCHDPYKAAEATARCVLTAERLKGSNPENAAKTASNSILANVQERTEKRGKKSFDYNDFCAFQEVLGQLPGICSLVYEVCHIKKGAVSADDLKVANRVTGLGGKVMHK